MMRPAVLGMAAAAFVVAATGAYAAGYHAIAYDQGNVVVGFAMGAASAGAARDKAVSECQRDGGASCRLIWSDQGGGCVAIATTGSGSFTLEAGGSEGGVQAAAMRECAGFADGDSCQVEVSFCSNG